MYRRYQKLASILLVAALGACGDEDPISPVDIIEEEEVEEEVLPTAILILHDDSTHVEASQVLADAGSEVTDGGPYWEYTGTDFDAYDLVILLDGYEYGYEMMAGVEQALLDYVSDGGVLLTTDWMGYDYRSGGGYFETLYPALPLIYEDDYCDVGEGSCQETYTVAASHPITEGLPSTFTTPSDWTYSMAAPNSAGTNVVVLFSGSGSGAAMAVGDRGRGHFVHWSMAGVYGGAEIWDANTEMILNNVAAFANPS